MPDAEVPGGERIKVLDIGIAKVLGATAQTATGALLGTVHDMSPGRLAASTRAPPAERATRDAHGGALVVEAWRAAHDELAAIDLASVYRDKAIVVLDMYFAGRVLEIAPEAALAARRIPCR